ncbi:DUF2079 domain-containing protein [Patescibacteria group bacterium]|nr:DUF2079 domain-containing protein [Patescibacteria group bacterium]
MPIFLKKHSKKILWLGIFLYFSIFCGICIWKYSQFGYNGLDLAIFNQVYSNSTVGQLFQFTIHPQSYLGDHLALIIIPLLPLYYFFRHPLCLLIMQTLIIALTAWPIYKISQKLFAGLWPLFFSLAWLFNPFTQNINIFEFHHLPFAVFLIFWAFYFYQNKRFTYFILFTVLSLMVREDVALVMVMFPILALLEKRGIKWIIWPGLISLGWFFVAIKIISYFSPESQYKFLYYYSWLGQSWTEIIINTFAHPLLVLKHLATWHNLMFTLGLMLPFAYLLKIRYLLLGFLIYLQLIFGGSSNSTIILSLHYSALLLPALFIAFIYFIKNITKLSPQNKLKLFLGREKLLTVSIITIAIIYSCLTLGPLPAVIKNLVKPTKTIEITNAKKEFLQTVSVKNSVVTTYEFLAPLSNRSDIYSLHYAFIGKQQFSDVNYTLPENLDVMLIDFDDFLTYELQFPNIKAWQQYYQDGDNNIRKLIKERDFKVTKVFDSLVLMEKDKDLDIILYERGNNFNNIQHPKKINLDNKINFLGWNDNQSISDQNLKSFSFYWQATKKLEENYQLKLILKDENDQIIYEKIYALAYGLCPTTEWQTNEVIKTNYWFYTPQKIANLSYKIELELVELKGFLKLDGLRSVIPIITKENKLTPHIKLLDK